jgi:choline-sulfatase
MKLRNILILMADEFRHDAPGFMGNHLASTPCLDALARGASVFKNAYTPSPVCVPARPSLATGKYPLHIDCQHFGEDLAPDSLTFARWFADHGYYTVACGKLHHRGPDQMQGWMHRFGGECAVNWPEPYASRSQIGRSAWTGAPELKRAGTGISPLSLHDDYSISGAEAFLQMHFGGMYPIAVETPVMLFVSLQQPHFPFLTEAASLSEYIDRVPVAWGSQPAHHPVLDAGRLGAPDITEDDVRRATAIYYSLVKKTDTRFARVLQALRDCGQNPDDWGILFLSDHGDMLGSHGLWEKRKFYEESVHVPLFVRWPGVGVARHSRNVNLVDVFPTLCDLAGLPTPDGLDGRSLFASTEDTTFSQMGSTHFMVKRGALKLIDFASDGPQVLFDLANDPQEEKNVIDDPRHAPELVSLREALSAHRASR